MSFLSSTGNMHISVLTQFLIKGDAFNFNEVIMRMWVGFLSVSRVDFYRTMSAVTFSKD